MEEASVEVGLAGEVVGVGAGAEVLAGVLVEVSVEPGLAGVIPMFGPAMVCLMVIPTLAGMEQPLLIWDMDLVTHTMVTAQRSLMATAPGKGAQTLGCL